LGFAAALAQAAPPPAAPPQALPSYDLAVQPIQGSNLAYRVAGDNDPDAMCYYTRLGTDYGPLAGPRAPGLRVARAGVTQVVLAEDQACGMRYSMDGLGQQNLPGLCLAKPYPPLIEDRYQPKIIGADIRVKGQGRIKLQLDVRGGGAGSGDAVTPHRGVDFTIDSPNAFEDCVWLWSKDKQSTELLRAADLAGLIDQVRAHLPGIATAGPAAAPAGLSADAWADPRVCFMDWLAEGKGTDLTMDDLGLLVAMPRLDLAHRALLKSLAKFAACDEHSVGLVRDRASFPPGGMDNVPTSGMFCLALAAAAQEGLVDADAARGVLGAIHALVRDPARMPRRGGLLPHFVRWLPAQGRYVAYEPERAGRPGLASEFSTIDTSLYYHGMLLAAAILGAKTVERELLEDLGRIEVEPLVVEKAVRAGDGRVHRLHFVRAGYTHDGAPLPYLWDAWGGEGALVVALARLAGYPQPLDIDDPYAAPDAAGARGRVCAGTGFIAEIQSLFYPQFDSDRPDALTHVDWLAARRQLLAAQVACTLSFGATPAGALNLYGFSAGEGLDGQGYLANGVRRRRDAATGAFGALPVLHPHYILMSACTPADPALPRTALENLEKAGLFPPLGGLVENCALDLKQSLAMLGSLNAAFDTLGAYHYLCRTEGRPDAIYEAARRSPELCQAVRDFYPPGVTVGATGGAP
jgi:hypothetical protein